MREETNTYAATIMISMMSGLSENENIMLTRINKISSVIVSTTTKNASLSCKKKRK